MHESYSIPLAQLIKEFSLTPVYLPDEAENIMISNTEVNRPGLALAGFFELFEPTRIQIMGKAEYLYLEEREEETRNAKIEDLLRHKSAAIILTTAMTPVPHMVEMAK